MYGNSFMSWGGASSLERVPRNAKKPSVPEEPLGPCLAGGLGAADCRANNRENGPPFLLGGGGDDEVLREDQREPEKEPDEEEKVAVPEGGKNKEDGE